MNSLLMWIIAISSFYVLGWKMAKHTLNILQCQHRNIFQKCFIIFQHYAWKG